MKVIEAWQAWAPTAPDELAASLLVTAGAEGDEPPVVNVFGAMLGSDADTAFVHRSELFLLKHAVVLDPGASTAVHERARGWLERSWQSGHAWGSGGVYPNFPDADLPDPERAHYGANYERLLRVKRRYDPGGFLPFT